jgi:hypothetical protein
LVTAANMLLLLPQTLVDIKDVKGVVEVAVFKDY